MTSAGVFRGHNRALALVLNRMKEEAASRSSGAGEGAIAGGKDDGNFVDAHVAAGNVEHGADEVAHHVVEESIAANAVHEQMEAVSGLLVPCGEVDGPDGRARLRLDGRVFGGIRCANSEIGIGGGEAAEVVFAEECGGGGIKGGKIHAPRVGIDISREKRRADLRRGGFDGENAVLVGFGDGGVAGVEPVGDDLCSEDADRSGQRAVERSNEIGGWDVRLKSDAGNLSQCVHAGIGAARSLGQGRFAEDAAKRGLQFALNGGFARLNLPAREVGSVVSDGELPRLRFLRRILFQYGLGGVGHGNQG